MKMNFILLLPDKRLIMYLGPDLGQIKIKLAAGWLWLSISWGGETYHVKNQLASEAG